MADQDSTGKGLSAIASNPLLGVTAPIGGAILWIGQLLTSVESEVTALRADQADFSVALVQMRSQIDRNGDKIEANGSNFDAGREQIDHLASSIPALRTEVEVLRKSIETQHADLARLDRRLSILEDDRR